MLDLFGQLAPLSGDLLQAFFRVAIGRALGLLRGLCRMLAVLFARKSGTWGADASDVKATVS